MLRAAALALPLALLAGTAPADPPGLHCLGSRPGFMFSVEAGDVVRFDYLGDGQFGLDPALTDRFEGFRGFELVTARERWDLWLETRACRIIGIDLPLSLEIAVPSSGGLRPLTACCRWVD
ncbi:hypothetical protein [Histidinibacterium lentulum]|uniref:Uncharacterized protein n=1 Tax=Histidinibacterium lentulum TaxID=2480588 RepID=A0A3N2R9P6_9RHOB|nr:hypothetical protein [Histidinibacterium lentulum]ROU04184.1 hypothetical protein EAT49_01985 [Histidinibacterium lentulum]